MNDHALVMALHAAISRRSWHEVERAANAIRDDKRIQWPAPSTHHTLEAVPLTGDKPGLTKP